MSLCFPLFPSAPATASGQTALLQAFNQPVWNNRALSLPFEQALATLLGHSHAIALSSCTAALYLALKAHHITGPVLIPSHTWVAVVNAVLAAHLPPLFYDIDPATAHPTPTTLATALAASPYPDPPEAIILCHYAGSPCPMPSLLPFIQSHALTLIQDLAEAMTSTLSDVSPGPPHTTCLSFSHTKILNLGEGGALLTSDPSLYSLVHALAYQGIQSLLLPPLPTPTTPLLHRPSLSFPGLNLCLHPFLAALGLDQLTTLHQESAARTRIAAYYRTHLIHPFLAHLTLSLHAAPVFQFYPIRILPPLPRDSLAHHLAQAGIQTAAYFNPPIHRSPYAASTHWDATFHLPATDLFASQVLLLPIYSSIEPYLAFIVEEVQKGLALFTP